ncbi:MAG: hypothetical protein ACOZFS_08255 [Thermodesulfobacteriota bacterium]
MNYVVYFSNAGAPAENLQPTISIFKKVADGTDIVTPPAVAEIGGGFYKFTATPAEALVVQVDGGAILADADRYKVMQITPNDGGIAAIQAKTDSLPTEPASNTEILGAIAALNDLTVAEILNGDLSESLTFPANSLADLIRKLFWIVCNRMVINDASGAFTAYKTDGVTPAASGIIRDDGITTERSEISWP